MTFTIFQKLKKPSLSIKHEIHKRLAGWEEPRPHFPLRASDLFSDRQDFCPREHAFMDLGLAKKKGQFVGTAQRMTYDHGGYMERKLRDEYLRDIVVGQWKCSICNHRHPTFGKAPTVHCPSCTYKRWVYFEPEFDHVPSGVQGHMDFFVDASEPKIKLVECKTMAPDDFKKLVAPLGSHKIRTALYLKLIAESKWEPAKRINTRSATIIYVMKAFGLKDESIKQAGIKDAAFSPFKEFTIERDDSLLTSRLAQATTLKKWRDDKSVGMPCGICSSGFEKRAQGCAAVGACWSGKYPSVVTWLENEKPRHPGKKLI